MESYLDAVAVGPLAERLEQVIRSRTNGMIRALRVDVSEGGGVVLSGRASTYYAKQLATHAVLDLLDDDTVPLTNDIDVC